MKQPTLRRTPAQRIADIKARVSRRAAPNTEQQLVGIRDALLTLGITGDRLFARIREDLDRGLIQEARTHLNFVDKIVNANAPQQARAGSLSHECAGSASGSEDER